MRTEHQCGRVGVQSVDVIAHRAASFLIDSEKLWALTLDPSGLVLLERVKTAHPDDLLGVFNGDAGLFGTSRLVRDELLAAIASRPLAPYKRRVRAARRPQAA